MSNPSIDRRLEDAQGVTIVGASNLDQCPGPEQPIDGVAQAALQTLGYSTYGNGATSLDVEAARTNIVDKQVKTGSQRYVLVKYKNSKVHSTCSLPSIPSAKSIRLIPANEVRYTMEDMPIREHTANRAWGLSFRGMTGVKIYGMPALLACDHFINQYHFDAHNDGSLYLNNNKQREVRDRTWLELWDLEDGMCWRVEVKGWDWDRSAQTRVRNAEWALSLQGYSFVNRSPVELNVDFRAKGLVDKSKISQSLSEMATLEKSVRDANEAAANVLRNGADAGELMPWKTSAPALLEQLGKIADYLKSNPVFKFGLAVYQAGMAATALVKKAVTYARAVIDSIHSFTTLVSQLTTTWTNFIENVANTARQLVNSIIGAVSAVRRALRTLVNFYGDLVNLPHSAMVAWRAIKDSILSLGDLQSHLTKGLGKGGGKIFKNLNVDKGGQAGVSGMPNTFTQSTDARDSAAGACVQYKFNDGDSLESLAMTLYGDPNMWAVLADFNKMQGARTLADGSMLRPGALLLLPYSVTQGLNVPQAQQVGDLYGTDWAIDPATGDRVSDNRPYVSYDGTNYTTTSPQGGDFRHISGLPNLLQAVSHRVRTVVGDVPVAPDYGALPFPTGTALTSAQLAQVMVSVRANMLRDGRVLRVSKLVPVHQADKINLSMQVVPVTGGSVGVVTPLGN